MMRSSDRHHFKTPRSARGLRPPNRGETIGDHVAIGAEEGDVEGLEVVPMMTLKALSTAAPFADFRPDQLAELLRERRRVAGRPRANSPGFERVETNREMTIQAGELGMQTETSGVLHDGLPVVEGDPESRHEPG